MVPRISLASFKHGLRVNFFALPDSFFGSVPGAVPDPTGMQQDENLAGC